MSGLELIPGRGMDDALTSAKKALATALRERDEAIEEIRLVKANREAALASADEALIDATTDCEALATALRKIKQTAQTYNQPDRRDLWKWLNELGQIATDALAALEGGSSPRRN